MVVERAGSAEVTLAYPPHLVDEEEVEAFFEQFLRLLRGWPEVRGLRAADLALLDAPGRKQVLETWNDTRRLLDESSDVLSRFDFQAQTRPDATALICGNGRTTYSELRSRSLRFAAHLRSLGIEPTVQEGLFAGFRVAVEASATAGPRSMVRLHGSGGIGHRL